MSKQNPLMGETKKKHHLWGLWIPLIVIFAIVVVPVGIAAALFYDPSHIDTGITERKEESKIFSSVMTDMFDGCRNEEPSIDLTITQKQLNQLLFNASASMPEKASEFLKQFSVQIENDEKYIFDLEISAFNILKTHIRLETKVAVNVELDNGKKGFLFVITDLKVGRMGNLEGILPWIANTAGLDLSSILSGAGLSIKFDIDNLILTYTFDDFINDMSSMSGSADPLFLNIFTNFFTGDYISFNHYKDEKVVGSIGMSRFLAHPFYTNSDYANSTRPIIEETPMLTYFAGKVESMIDKGIIENNSTVADNARTMLKFLTYGEDYLGNSSETNFVNSVYSQIQADYCGGLTMKEYSDERVAHVFGASEMGIMDRVTGEVSAKIGAMSDAEKIAFLNKIKTSESKKAYIYDSANPLIVHDYEVQDLLKDNDKLISYGFSFVSERDDGSAKVSYAMLDSVYPTILEETYDNGELVNHDTMCLSFGLNINGAPTTLVMPMEGEEIHEGGKQGLSFSLGDTPLYFGSETFPDLKGQLQNIMNGISSDEGDMIQFVNDEHGNVSKIQMVFDFEDYFANNDTPFTQFNTLAEANGAALVVNFEFKKSDNDESGKRAGQFNVTVGYEQKTTA